MAIKAKMLGRSAVMRKLGHLVPEAEEQLATAQLEAAKELASDIATRAPTGATGNYKASIEGDRLENRPGRTAAVGTSETKDKNATGVFAAWYWRFIEFGTAPHAQPNNPRVGYKHPGARAQPHIFPTFRAKRKAIRRKMANAVNRAVRKTMGK